MRCELLRSYRNLPFRLFRDELDARVFVICLACFIPFNTRRVSDILLTAISVKIVVIAMVDILHLGGFIG